MYSDVLVLVLSFFLISNLIGFDIQPLISSTPSISTLSKSRMAICFGDKFATNYWTFKENI